MNTTEQRKETNKKLWTVLGILFLMIGCLGNLEEKPKAEQPKQEGSEQAAETEEQKMLAALPYLMLDCEKTIKSHLNFPSTYKSSTWESNTQINGNRAVIETVFTAKNAYNLELKFLARCYYNDSRELLGFEMEEKG